MRAYKNIISVCVPVRSTLLSRLKERVHNIKKHTRIIKINLDNPIFRLKFDPSETETYNKTRNQNARCGVIFFLIKKKTR